MNEEKVLEVIQPSAIESIERAQTDIQISTAKRYPRVMSAVKKSMMEFATLDEETAAGCFYTLPRQGKNIQGPSVRMAEIALSCFQNVKVGSRIIANDGKTITAQGVCHDLQNNVCVSVEVKRRITDKMGKTYNEDMQVVTGNAACSIALRNATFRVVPLALVKPVYEAAKRVAVGDATTLSDRRAKCVDTFAKMGVGKDKLLAKLEKKAVEDITLDDLEILIGLHTAIKDGDTSIDEAFTPAAPAKPIFKTSPPADAKAESGVGLAPAAPTVLPDPPKPANVVVPQTGEPLPQAAETPQSELEKVLEGVTFDDFLSFAKVQFAMIGGNQLDSFSTWAELPSAFCKTVLANEARALARCKKTYASK